MGIIREQTKHPDFPVRLEVVERQGGEWRAPWQFIALDVDGLTHRYSPKELRQLGRWLTQEGKRLGREFKSNGAPKA